jgi:thiosulfate/3-mercaptopyruvate sulfurtransferase
MGFPHVHVLDGGLKAWTVEGRQTESGDASAAPVAFTPAFDAAMVRDAAAILAIVESGSAQIVDARPGPRFRGETPEPRAGLRSGHMPGARNLAWNAVISSDGRLRPSAELETAFRDAEVDLSRPIVTTCGSGVTAAVLALALARLGHDRIPIYDGSWTEWGGRPDTPITTGP